jgi:PPM family protein phosphatase
LLCSDGLSGVVSRETLSATLSEITDVGQCTETLVQLALRAGAPDNVTVVVADVVELDSLPDGAAPPTTPQVVGSAAIDRNRPSRGGDGAAARAAEVSAGTRPPDEPIDEDVPPPRRILRRLLTALGVVAILAAIGSGLWFGWGWTQQQYFVAESDGRVAIFQGIHQTIGPVSLFEVHEVSDLRVNDLPAFMRERLAETVQVGSLDEAEQWVADREAEVSR